MCEYYISTYPERKSKLYLYTFLSMIAALGILILFFGIVSFRFETIIIGLFLSIISISKCCSIFDYLTCNEHIGESLALERWKKQMKNEKDTYYTDDFG